MPIALLGALADDPVLQLDNSSINAALAAGSLMRAFGKAVNGVTVDVVGVRPFLTALLLAPVAAAGCLSGANGQTSLVLVFGALAFCNSGAWLAGCKIIEGRFRREDWASCFSVLATCSRLGSMVARMGLGGLLAVLRWQSIALGSAPVLFLSWAFTTRVLLRENLGSVRGHLNVSDSDLDDMKVVHKKSGGDEGDSAESSESRAIRIKRMLGNRGLQLQACIVASASCLMALENMCPLLLKDLTSLGNAEIGMLATFFPAGVLCGVLATPQIYARLSTPRNKLAMELLLQLLTLLAIIMLGWLSSLGPNVVHPAFFLACLATAAFGIALNYYIKPGMHTLEFGEDCATASSILDGSGMVAAVLFQLTASSIFGDGGSWAQVLAIAALCVLVMATCTVLLFLERNATGVLKMHQGGDIASPWALGRKAPGALPGGALAVVCALRVAQTHLVMP
eukprot:CAMPEP_0115522024 /NCGR_PEP_ID=MMETSP0271-20121206/79857_1 /TAXON_ID=71861 /ORGANISM="Scrippsiella trochoidea, Strain CCMP3099" /LENGTH=452 /DNA_ID=CAMNT_0002953291 /DNA_START=59 /DNA_END=1413 /DNA_ORIENTATION=-